MDARQAYLSFTISWSLLKFMSVELVISSSHLILVAFFSSSFNLYQQQFLSNDSALCIRWPKYWSFSFSISPSNEYSGLISFRMDWLDLLAVQGTYWTPSDLVGLIFQCPTFLPFHTVHGVLPARILEWFAIPSSSGPHFVRTPP